MKHTAAACGLFVYGLVAAMAADPSASPTPLPLEKTPLPPGPLVRRMTDFSMWRIQFTYATDKPAGKEAPGDKPEVPEKVSDSVTLPPRTVSITRTRPYYHVVLVDKASRPSELWFDGGSSYLSTPGQPGPYLPGLNPGGGSAIPPYLDFSHVDFPDVDWVSAKTYIGTLKGETASYLVFQLQEKGPTVWIDADTRRPMRWQNAVETRKFEYLDAPTEKLILPPAVMQAARMIHRIDEITSHRPPRGS